MTTLLLGLLLFALSLLAVVPPPHAVFWLLSVPVKEWGHLLALLCLPLLWPGFSHGWMGIVAAVLAAVALVLFLMPLLTALPVARRLPAELAAAFGSAPGLDRPPLSIRRLLVGARLPRLATETRVYADHGDGRPLQMEITRPPQGGPAPVILVVHGGSWRSGDRTQLPGLGRYLAARGYLVAAIDYRLAPTHRFPAPVDDVKAAIAYIKAQAAALGADPDRFVLLGRSAGGHVAAVAAYTADDPAIRGVISFYGPFDLAWGWDEPGWILPTHEILGQYLGGRPEEYPEVYKLAQVVELAKPGLPPTLLIQGQADVLVSPLHNDKLSARLRPAGVPHHIVKVPLGTHGSDFNLHGPFGQISTYAVEQFLARVMPVSAN
jgi:acetyl esterase/lipase